MSAEFTEDAEERIREIVLEELVRHHLIRVQGAVAETLIPFGDWLAMQAGVKVGNKA